MIGIYKIVNKINNKVYIGQSININKRIKEHFWKAQCEKDVSYNSVLHSAIRKYGKENFEWEIIEECDIEEIDEKEKYYIQFYNSLAPKGYNILEGGQKFRSEPNRCKKCGTIISHNASYCVKCFHTFQYICEHPTREELKNLIRNFPFTEIAKQYNVSDKTISKWCKSENLPFRKKDIKQYSDKEWEDL